MTTNGSRPLRQTPALQQEEHFDTSRVSPQGMRRVSQGSLQRTPPAASESLRWKPVPLLEQPGVRLQGTPASPVSISPPRPDIREPDAASIRQLPEAENESRWSCGRVQTPDSALSHDSVNSLPIRTTQQPRAQMRLINEASHGKASSGSHAKFEESVSELHPLAVDEPQAVTLQYHAFDDAAKQEQQRASRMTMQSPDSSSSGGGGNRHSRQLQVLNNHPALPRPAPTYALGSELRGRTLSPLSANGSDPGSPRSFARDISSSRRSPGSRPTSYIDLLNNVPYHQQVAPGGMLNNADLQSTVGSAASLLDTKKTLEMYRANVKKTNDAAVQYEFAIFCVNATRDVLPGDGLDPAELVQDAKHILQRLADRAYPFAQYYLGDGYFSGLFNKDRPDHDKAFPLFLAASKHGHAEAGFRAALCYEFGWGTAKSYPKAVQFYRNAASKNHPGAATRLGLACLRGDMGLGKSSCREGIKWLKRAQESADMQYNSAPYELGLLHLSGFGDDIFKDETYAAQLLTQSAELGHVQANFLMGQAYESGLYGCPRDAALSLHFYNGAATKGHADAMMALCAWYLVGAEPVLEKDEGEAYQWAFQAAETGYSKAEYAVGYFTEMGIGCRRDPLEANVRYVRAADQGNENAKQRLAIIRAAASGDPGIPMSKAEARTNELAGNDGKKKKFGIF